MNYNRLQTANKIARKTFHRIWGTFPEHYQRKELFSPSFDAVLGSYRKTQKQCSLPCCGNPRKWFGEITLQEKKHIEAHEI